jgi:tetratricopeptide (TPR) repeat protein
LHWETTLSSIYLKQAKAVSSLFGQKHNECDVIFPLTFCEYALGHHDKSNKLYFEYLALAEETGQLTSKAQATVHNIIGINFEEKKDYQTALEHFRKA